MLDSGNASNARQAALISGTAPNQSPDIAPPMTEAERYQILVEWNDTQAPYPQGVCFHQIFEQQAERSPDVPAVVYADKQLTYRQLNARANQLAHYLRQLGVGPEVLVGLSMERSQDLLVGLLGILKAGGAYVPLDPAYPQDRLAFMLQDAQVSILVTQASLLERLPPHQAHVVCLDSDWQKIAQQPQDNPVSGVTADNLAYVIYTSGSTGKPKGVLVPHRGIPNLAEAQHRIYRTEPGCRVLQTASFGFDASVADLLIAFSAGGTLYMATEDERIPGPALVRLLQKHAITIAVFMPSMLATLPADDLPALQVIISAGEACSADLVAKWARGRHFLNVYGPTEATVAATFAECTDNNQAPPIGHPLPNTQVYVLDEHLQPLAVGVAGELYLGGVGLARGYLNRPELTAERFITNPFSSEPGERLYRTGDLVRWRADGNLEYIGRADQQVKLRGFRIELGEIETMLKQHPQVREAVVVVREDTPGDKRLVAYIAPTNGSAPTSATLRGFLQAGLPYYMVPSAFVFLEVLPLNHNGKVDRRALPAPDDSTVQDEQEYRAPDTPLQIWLADIWKRLLGLRHMSIDADFFEQGGHSLLAVKLLSQVQEQFQVEVPLSSFFEAPTIADLAAQIELLLVAKIEMMSDEEVQRLLE